MAERPIKRSHFLPNQFLRVGDVVHMTGCTRVITEVFPREPIHHRYMYAARHNGVLNVIFDNAYSDKVRRVYRDGALIWLTFGVLDNNA